MPGPGELMSLYRGGRVKNVVELLTKGARADIAFFEFVAACSNPKLLEELRKVHDFFLHSQFRGNLQANNKLLEMYAKCEAMPHAHRTFDNVADQNITLLFPSETAMDYYGKRLATTSSDNTIKIIGVSGNSHQQLATLSGHREV
jgi:hypothetical protein